VDELLGRVWGEPEVLLALVDAADEGALGAGDRRGDVGGADDVAVDEGGWIEREVGEADSLAGEGVGEGDRAETFGAHPCPVVVEAGLPADEVFHVRDVELDGVDVADVVAGAAGDETGVGGAEGYMVGSRVRETIEVRVVTRDIGGTGGDHVKVEARVLDGAGGECAGEK
jgi:hypothetical protein